MITCPHCGKDVPTDTTLFKCPFCRQPLFGAPGPKAKVVKKTASARRRGKRDGKKD